MKAFSLKAIPRSVLHPITTQHCLFKGLVHDDTLARFAPRDGSMELFLPVAKTEPEVEFMSNCYSDDATFVIYVSGLKDGESEATVKNLIPLRFRVVSEDLYEFPDLTPKEAHSHLQGLGFKYKGPCDKESMDTSIL